MGAIHGKWATFTYKSFILVSKLRSLSSEWHKAQEPFCMNSLIRKTLGCGSHPLFLLILVGKYFIDFCSNRKRAELRRALSWIRRCGGFQWWVRRWRGCVRGKGETFPLTTATPFSPERTNYSCELIIAHLFPQHSLFTPYPLRNFWWSFFRYPHDRSNSFTNIWIYLGFCLCSVKRSKDGRWSDFHHHTVSSTCKIVYL